MELILIFAVFSWAIIGYVIIPIMKVFGIVVLISGVIFTFLGIMFVFSSPWIAILFLILAIMTIKNDKSNRRFI